MHYKKQIFSIHSDSDFDHIFMFVLYIQHKKNTFQEALVSPAHLFENAGKQIVQVTASYFNEDSTTQERVLV